VLGGGSVDVLVCRGCWVVVFIVFELYYGGLC